MIPYADLERALARWKMRQAGGEPAHEAPDADAYAEVVVSEPSGLIQLGPDDDELDRTT